MWNGEEWVWTESEQEQGIGIPFRDDNDDDEGSGIDRHVASELRNNAYEEFIVYHVGFNFRLLRHRKGLP